MRVRASWLPRPHGVRSRAVGIDAGIVLAWQMSVHGSAIPVSGPKVRGVRFWLQAMKADLARMTVLAIAALGIGRALDGTRQQPLGWTYRPPEQRLQATLDHLQPHPVPGAPMPSPIDLEAFRPFVTARRGIVVDARAQAFYRLGHVPGALSLPRESFGLAYQSQKTALETRQADEVAVYCSEADCPDAELVAEALGRLGFRRLRVYQAGWEEWVQAGLPQEGGPQP